MHAFVRTDAGDIGPGAGCFQAFWRVAFRQTKNAQATTVGLFGVPSCVENSTDEDTCLFSDFLGPA